MLAWTRRGAREVAGTGWTLLVKRDHAEAAAPLRVLAWSMGIFESYGAP